MKQKVFKIGNSLGVTVPSDFVKAVGIRPGATVEVKKRIAKNEVIYRFSGIQQLLIAESFFKNPPRAKAKQRKK